MAVVDMVAFVSVILSSIHTNPRHPPPEALTLAFCDASEEPRLAIEATLNPFYRPNREGRHLVDLETGPINSEAANYTRISKS